MTDPRDRRGRVHPLPFVLALAVLVVTAGARTSLENAEQSTDLAWRPDPLRGEDPMWPSPRPRPGDPQTVVCEAARDDSVLERHPAP
ncbi:hypothetical protein ACFC5Z_32275 [Streptomyces sp. NPDC056004]|uniref:hypothetical protein n=1 Tax=Streptomyces sp. NPDC056004 TaxID=3345677 RepID=UPI0035DEA448